MASADVTLDANTTTSLTTPSPCPPSRTPSPVQSSPQSVNEDPQSVSAPSLRSNLSWRSIRSVFNVSERTSAQLGWAVAFISVLLTIITLSPVFKSQDITEKAFELAEWTALKDYIEECRDELAAGSQSQDCLRATNANLPPPPYVRPGILDKMRRRESGKGRYNEGNASSTSIPTPESQVANFEAHPPRALQGLVGLVIALTACVFLFLSLKSNRSRTLRRSYTKSEKRQEDITPPTYLQPPETTTSSTLRHPPPPYDTTLRRRPIRNHPIYRHVNLEEAIHEGDLPEIRTRLQNGEDVNQHWPYLIYRLAISPPTTSTTKRLEIAQLCLDFGADVNALKGWNGQSALMIAFHFGNVDVAKMLIAKGATFSYRPGDRSFTTLHDCIHVAYNGSATDALELMKMLFQCSPGVDANQADRLGETPLHKLLIDAWYLRDDDVAMKKLYPIAFCLLGHGARLPKTIEDKYKMDNPLWEVMYTATKSRVWARK